MIEKRLSGREEEVPSLEGKEAAWQGGRAAEWKSGRGPSQEGEKLRVGKRMMLPQ